MLILKGFPLNTYSPRERDLFFWLFGCFFGQPVSQNTNGDKLGRVENLHGMKEGTRAYRNCKELRLHRDRGDLLMMLCARQSVRGGETLLSSGYAIYNELIKKDPDCIELLCEGFKYHIIEPSVASSGKAVTSYKLPVFSWCNQVMTVQYIRPFIEKGALVGGVSLSDKQVEALDEFDRAAYDKNIYRKIKLEPGDIFICNNNTVMHGRTQFPDNRECKGRLMLRLWLISRKKWPLVTSLKHRNHTVHDYIT